MTKTQQRAAWIKTNKNAILKTYTDIVIPPRHKGYNAKGIKGMSGGGWGWWANAFAVAGINCDVMPYWSGSNPTPSTAINAGIANFICQNAPADIR